MVAKLLKPKQNTELIYLQKDTNASLVKITKKVKWNKIK